MGEAGAVARPGGGVGTRIVVDSVTKVFPGAGGEVAALGPLSLRVDAGEFVAVLGPSGCGKSTLLRMIAGLEAPTRGEVSAELASGGKPDVAFVFQDAHLLPWRNVLRNAALPLELRRAPRAERLEAARGALDRVGLGDALRRYPAQLSGGMRMRVSLARALVTRPGLMLLDEPFAALDEITRHHLDDMLRRLYLASGMTVVFVTHSIVEAAFLADRVVVMSRRPGRVVLDRRLALPRERAASLRAEPAFVSEMRALYDALERAERGEA